MKRLAAVFVLTLCGCPSGIPLGTVGDACDENRACLSKLCVQNICVAANDAAIDTSADAPPCTGCLISGTCRGEGDTNPNNSCEHCDTAVATTMWSPKPTSASCDDPQLPCAVGRCDGAGTCTDHQHKSGSNQCLIEGVCHDAGPGTNPCEECIPSEWPQVWLPAEGCVTTLIGNGNATNDNGGSIQEATVAAPRALAYLDGALFFAGSNTGVLRRAAGKAVKTYAGTTLGFKDGLIDAPNPADQPQFSEINYIVALPGQTPGAPVIYLADGGDNRRIRLIDGNTVSTFVGSGNPVVMEGSLTVSSFLKPLGLAVTSATSQLIVTDSLDHRIRQVDFSGTPVTGTTFHLAGTGAVGTGGPEGPALLAELDQPWSIALAGTDKQDPLVFVDKGNHRVSVLEGNPAARVLRQITGGAQGFQVPDQNGDLGMARSLKLTAPEGLAISSSNEIYVADTGNNRIVRLDGFPQDETAVIVAGGMDQDTSGFADGDARTAALFSLPRALALSASQKFLFVADKGNNRIRVIRVKP